MLKMIMLECYILSRESAVRGPETELMKMLKSQVKIRQTSQYVLRLPFLFLLWRFPPLGVWCLVQRAQWNKFPSSARGRRRLNWRRFSGSSPRNIGGECAGLPIYLLMFMECAPSKIDELVSSEEYLLSPLQNHRGRVTRIEALPCTSPLQGRTIFDDY